MKRSKSRIVSMFTAIAAVLSAFPTDAFSPTYAGLQSTPLVRASDEASLPATSLWRQNTPFGIADETAVFAFLRHYG